VYIYIEMVQPGVVASQAVAQDPSVLWKTLIIAGVILFVFLYYMNSSGLLGGINDRLDDIVGTGTGLVKAFTPKFGKISKNIGKGIGGIGKGIKGIGGKGIGKIGGKGIGKIKGGKKIGKAFKI